MSKRVFVLCLVLLVVLAHVAEAGTTVVAPDGTGDQPTIQAAVDAALTGDVVELLDGVFVGNGNRNVNLGGKAITIRSQNGDPSACVVDGESTPGDPHDGFLFLTGEGVNTRLDGISIVGTRFAILTDSAAPTVAGCRLVGNEVGLFSSGTGVVIEATVISGNETAMNLVTGSWSLISSTVAGNGRPGSASTSISFGTLVAHRSIVWGNCATPSGHEVLLSDANMNVTCSIVDPAAIGSVVNGVASFDEDSSAQDPLFCDPDECGSAPSVFGDYSLRGSSPALPSQSLCGMPIGALGEGCAAIPTTETSWGAIKSKF